MQTNNVKNISLIDSVFSWSIDDVLNKDLYEKQIKQIPKTFSSTEEYLQSFINPLLEETRCDLSSKFSTLHECFCSEIQSIKACDDFKLPNCLYYTIEEKRKESDESSDSDSEDDHDSDDEDELGFGDLIAITNVKPKSLEDLVRPKWPYVIAFVLGMDKETHDTKIESSKPILLDEMKVRKNSEALYAVKLINMVTNIRILDALNSNKEAANMNIIEKVLQPPFVDTEDCKRCHGEEQENVSYSADRNRIFSSDLNESQKAAVLSCIETRACCHENTVKLIWGPPGTGKTKTVGFLLHSLLKMRCETLTCAPTNIAVLEVTKRLVKAVRESYTRNGYGLGDVLLFGNKKRMKIKNHKDLHDVFIDYRVRVLNYCCNPNRGWDTSLSFMISLLDDPNVQYNVYLKEEEAKKEAEKKNADITREENKKKKKKRTKDKRTKGKRTKDGTPEKEWEQIIQNEKDQTEENKDTYTFGEFVKNTFNTIAQRLYFFINNLYKHLPTKFISPELVEKMFEVSHSLKCLENLLCNVSDELIEEAFKNGLVSQGKSYKEFQLARNETLVSLMLLPPKLHELCSNNEFFADKKEFCLQNSCLIFCTVSSSAKLRNHAFELVIIDEAAQLKECESAIPLQLQGLRHAFLVGDEKQLPAMVQSKVAEKADFGRSLFERLAFLGHKKHLLSVQHRMHQSISLFPNREFYDNKITNGPNVIQSDFNRIFLHGEMYGSYSFINVSHGEESFDTYSTKNMVEVSVVSEIVTILYQEFLRTKKPISVGVISPYKAQVHMISERFGKRYGSDAKSPFSVRVRSVDGFQGGEEDVIIISTVRCNVRGSIGFLSNRNRANVALTRARYCLWIVGSGTTLGKSNSVWKKLIIDAKERNCFHNAEQDPRLAQSVVAALLELKHFDALTKSESLLLRTAKWKVHFTIEFWRSMGYAKHDDSRKVFSLLEKLSSGWRESSETRRKVVVHDGSSSLLVEHYEVTKGMYLVWAVDVLGETSNCIQILKVWDYLPVYKLQKLSLRLDIVYGNYTVNKMNRCKHKLNDGNLVIPMSWPVDSASHMTNPPLSLTKPMASLSLLHKPETSSKNIGIKHKPKQVQRSAVPRPTWQPLYKP